MDPNRTYFDIIDAMNEEDHETARAMALVLKRWIESGGFAPERCTKEEIGAYIFEALWKTASM